MKLLKYLMPLVVALGFTSSIHAVNSSGEQDGNKYAQELNTRDWDAVREFINTKRTINLQEKSTNLTISGDVRTEWRHITEKQDNKNLRGGNAGTRTEQVQVNEEFGVIHGDHPSVDVGSGSSAGNFSKTFDSSSFSSNETGNPINYLRTSRNDFDIEFNLRFDYVCDRAWAVSHLQFDNAAGVDDTGKQCRQDPEGYKGSGEDWDLSLKRAYFGYNIYCDPCCRLDIEIGRRRLYDIFQSEVQFLSRFDGILLKYNTRLECIADMYLKLGAFVVDERSNHFAYVGETGVYNLFDYGFDLQYSFIYWNKNGRNRCFQHNPEGFKFQNSQVTLTYHLDPEIICMPAKIFGAFIYNHDRHRTHYTKNVRIDGHKVPVGAETGRGQNMAWYVGFLVGEIIQEGDWSVEAQYQVVQANAIPDNDINGIGRGNVLDDSYTQCGRGNSNFQGWRVEGVYALTGNLTLDTIIEWSRQYKKSIGGSHHYSKFEVEAIYAF